MIFERLSPAEIKTLLVISESGGNVRASNYHAQQPGPDGTWARYWGTLDNLVGHGLVTCRYELTRAGQRIVCEAERRRWKKGTT